MVVVFVPELGKHVSRRVIGSFFTRRVVDYLYLCILTSTDPRALKNDCIVAIPCADARGEGELEYSRRALQPNPTVEYQISGRADAARPYATRSEGLEAHNS